MRKLQKNWPVSENVVAYVGYVMVCVRLEPTYRMRGAARTVP
jgi:hypothetical protein